MEKLKKVEAFRRAISVFGDWRGWSRWQHIAYGLIRGVPYFAMEKYCNDNPDPWTVTRELIKLGAWPKPEAEEEPRTWWERLFGKKAVAKAKSSSWEEVNAHSEEIKALVVWVRKPVRVKIPRAPRVEPVSAAGE